ncbi:MAG: shikimate kinase [Firmicutes bacterium]|nr:shikimate kinase [Bacillota bacterium]MBQ4092565.1 shikimate kinase [Bacillota bacterium]
MEKKQNLTLIGMAGAGKSTLGVLLAKALGYDFIDTDILIQQKHKKLLQEIIDEEGIDAFLAIEEDILSELTIDRAIIATGGSAVYSDKAMQALKQHSTVVYLEVPYEEILSRVKNIATRGIVLKHGNSLKDAFEERQPLYHQYADIVVDCSKKDIESTLSEIINQL